MLRHSISYSRALRSGILFLAIDLIGQPCLLAQTPRAPDRAARNGDARLRQKIAGIISETVREGSGTTHTGESYYTFIPPSPEALNLVRGNSEAIPILEDYIWGKKNSEALVALKLLGSVGGERMVLGLRRVVESHPSQSFRIVALRWLQTVRWDIAYPIFTRAAANDRSESVRKAASELIAAGRN